MALPAKRSPLKIAQDKILEDSSTGMEPPKKLDIQLVGINPSGLLASFGDADSITEFCDVGVVAEASLTSNPNSFSNESNALKPLSILFCFAT